MLVSPASVVLSAPTVEDLGHDEVIARASRVAATVRAMGPRAREAAGAVLQRLVWHRSQPLGSRVDVTELCPEYFVAAGLASRSTAHRVWQALRPVLGWVEVGYHTVRALGVEVRRLRDGIHRHGRFVALGSDVRAAASGAVGLLGLPERPDRFGPAHDVRAAGRRALCPWHDDRHPSLTLDRDGTCRCFACGARGRWERTGDSVQVRRLETGGVRVPSARGNTPGNRTPPGTSVDVRGHHRTPPDADPRPAVPRGRYVLRSVSPGGVTQSSRSGEDLIGLLVRIDRYHASRVARIPVASCLPESTIPDRYVSLQRQTPTAWRLHRYGTRSVLAPASFRPVGGSRWVLLDYDDAADAPVDTTGDPRWWGSRLGPQVEAAARRALPGEATGRVLVQRSGLSGVHVLVELAADVDPDRLRVAWERLVAEVSPVVHHWFPGSVADPRALGVNRSIRAPGLRRTKPRDGSRPFVVRVAYASGLR